MLACVQSWAAEGWNMSDCGCPHHPAEGSQCLQLALPSFSAFSLITGILALFSELLVLSMAANFQAEKITLLFLPHGTVYICSTV